MAVIVRDQGFSKDDLDGRSFIGMEDAEISEDLALAIELPNHADLPALKTLLPKIGAIRINFPNFGDGRGFSIATKLRHMGYAGRLRASGHVIADQYALARRSGFDEIEIDDELAARQPENQWISGKDWKSGSYQDRLLKTELAPIR